MPTPRRRPIRVATISHRPDHAAHTEAGRDALLASTATLLERAARMGADLVAFPEAYPQLASPDAARHPEPHDAGTLPRVRELAARHRLHVVWPRFERDPDGQVRNVAHLVGRDGEPLGRYAKMFPTVSELAAGVVPGTGCPAFETDFGRVALLICFDMNFPEVRDALRLSRPDLIVFPSMYRGGLQAQALAYDTGAFVLTAVSSELGQVVDRAGRVLRESTYETLAVADVNTNSAALHMDFNWGKMDAMLARYGPALTFDYHTREAFYVVASTLDRDVSEVLAEFDLERPDDYYNRSRRAREAALLRHRLR
jgi:predicted amidohydrolase